MCFFFNMDKSCNFSEIFMEKDAKYYNHTGMEILWRQWVRWNSWWRFYGKISLEIVWGFSEQSKVNQITR